MDSHKNNNSVEQLPGGITIVRINGTQIKNIRQEKGLTQLYLSEIVGVTTDTISRWENRRYPSVKMENAQKLAQALEVELDEILDHHKETVPDTNVAKVDSGDESFTPLWHTLLFRICSSVFVLFSLALSWYFFSSTNNAPAFSATRILPPHVAPGQIFPVLIHVHNPSSSSIALILKETIPAGGIIDESVPAFTNMNTKNNEVHWIKRTDKAMIVFAYTVKAPESIRDNSKGLIFEGAVTLKKTKNKLTEIKGDTSVAIAVYHWADTNQDAMIDDEEILAVYDLYGDTLALNFNRDLIDDIWAGSGYRWNEKTKQFEILD